MAELIRAIPDRVAIQKKSDASGRWAQAVPKSAINPIAKSLEIIRGKYRLKGANVRVKPAGGAGRRPSLTSDLR